MSSNKTNRFPSIRMRRSRRTPGLRRLVAEATLSAADLIYPVFVLEGKNRLESVPSMPGVARKSIDLLMTELADVVALEIPAIALFPVIDSTLKSLDGAECANPDGLVQRTVRAIKSAYPDLAVITDIVAPSDMMDGRIGAIPIP